MSSKPMWTEGEWRVEGPNPRPGNVRLGYWHVEGRTNVANDITYADATLIAAAPGLYEAAEEAMKSLLIVLSPAITALLPPDRSARAHKAIDTLRAALDRAVGSGK